MGKKNIMTKQQITISFNIDVYCIKQWSVSSKYKRVVNLNPKNNAQTCGPHGTELIT